MKRPLLILLGMCFSAAALANPGKESPCPSVGSIHYDALSTGRYKAKTPDGVVWQSPETVGLDPTPPIKYLTAIGTGDRYAATVYCTYRVGKNSIVLEGNHSFILAKGWEMVATPSSGVYYFCKRRNTCASHRI